MHKYINLKKKYNKTPIFIYSLKKDEIYSFKLQTKSFKILKKKFFNISYYINYINTHCDENIDQYTFIIKSILKSIKD